MAWTESNEGRLINNTETVALVDASTASYTTWLKVPKGALITAAINDASTADHILTIDVEGSKSATPAASSGAVGGLNFNSLTHVAEDIMTDVLTISNDADTGANEKGDIATLTLGDLGYDYIRFKQISNAAGTTNVVYDLWYPLAKQDTITKTNGIGADPS
tara:strand:+ start:158 stop:643 length:486 start_codon:yes stop_codon:yes gene_type:complete